jgi:imidazolonepropionase-like amidohydrolase
MLAISDRVGTLAPGLDADVVLLDGAPFAPATSVVRVWVNGEEVL